MKKLTFLIMLLALSLTGFAQSSEDSTGDNSMSSYTEPIENTVLDFPLITTNISTETRNYLDSKLTSYNVYGFHFSDLRAWLDSNMYALDFNLGSTFLSLQRRDIRSPEYTQTETLEDGRTVTRFQQDLENDSTYEVHFLMGFADRDKNQIVRLSVEENGLTGYIWNTETNHVLYYTSLQDFIKSNNNDFTTSLTTKVSVYGK